MVQPDVFDTLVTATENESVPIAALVPLSTRVGQDGSRLNSMEHLRDILLGCSYNAEDLLTRRHAMLSNDRGCLVAIFAR